jgi:hypothetical protein
MHYFHCFAWSRPQSPALRVEPPCLPSLDRYCFQCCASVNFSNRLLTYFFSSAILSHFQWVQCLLHHFTLTGRIGLFLSHVLAWRQMPRSHLSSAAARRPPVDTQRYLHGLILVLEQIETMLPGTGTTPMAVMRDDSTWAAAPKPDPAHADRSADEQIPAAALPAISEAISCILVETLLPQLSPMFASVHKAVCTLSSSMHAAATDESECSTSEPQSQALVVDPEWTRLLEQWSAQCTTRSAHPALAKTTLPSASHVAPPAASSSASVASSTATSSSSASAAASSVADEAAVAPTLTDAALQLDAVYLALEAIVCMANAAGCTRLTRRLVLGGLGVAALQLMAAASAIDRAAVEAEQARRSTSASAASASPFATPEFRPDEATQGQGASQRAAAVSPPGLKVLALRVLCILAAGDKDLCSERVQDSAPLTALAGEAAAEAASTTAPLSSQLLMQITVARCEAVSLLLQQTAIEADQPYAREWAVLAVRLLSEDAADACSIDAKAAQLPAGDIGARSGHEDGALRARGAVVLYREGASKIRAQIEALQLRDVADQAELRRLGLKVSVEAAAAAAASGGAEAASAAASASASANSESGASAPKPRVTVRTMTPQERAASALLDRAAQEF